MAAAEQSGDRSAFDILFTTNVPHVLERLFFYLDYESYKASCNVSTTWQRLLTSESFKKKAKKVYRKGISADEKDLFSASKHGNKEKVRKLLSPGIIKYDQNFLACGIWKLVHTPLQVAAINGHSGVVQILIDEGADPNKTDKYGDTILVQVLAANISTKRQNEVVKVLIDGGADPNKEGEEGQAPLHIAAGNGRPDVAQLILECGGDPNKSDRDWGWTALHYASSEDRRILTKVLLDGGAAPNTVDKEGQTPLDLASFHGFKQVVKLLLEAGANPNVVNKKGYTPLILAAREDHLDVARLLIDAGADPNKANEIKEMTHDYVKELTQDLADGGVPAGEIAVAMRMLKPKLEAKSLLEQLYQPPDGDFGWTPLHWAAIYSKEVVRLLIDRGADANTASNKGTTPLHLAAEEGNKKVVQILLEAGADAKKVNERGDTPLSLAINNGRRNVFKLLRRRRGSRENVPLFRTHDRRYPKQYVPTPEGRLRRLKRLLKKNIRERDRLMRKETKH